MNPLGRIALSVVTVAVSAASAPLVLQDYSRLPPESSEMRARLAARLPLAKVIEAAEKETGGLASEAVLAPDGGVEVHTWSDAGHFVVEVDGETGAIKAKEARARIPGAAVEGAPTELPSGLMYYDIVVGTGAKPTGPGSTVKVHYSEWLTDGTQVFSTVGGKAYTTRLNAVVKGWTEGIGSMAVGGKRKLMIPHQLAYGPSGGQGIPPKAMLIFDIELLEVRK